MDMPADHHNDAYWGDDIHIGSNMFLDEDELQYSVIHEVAHHLGYGEGMANWFETACSGPAFPHS